jgi:hypothetical protein
MVKLALAEVNPPETTVMLAAPDAVMKLISTSAVNCVALTKFVGNCEPLNCTTAPGVNPVPFTVNGKDGCSAFTLGGLSELIVAGCDGPFTVKPMLLEPRLFAVTMTGNFPGAVIRLAGTKAVIWVGLTNVVCNGELFQDATVPDVNPVPFTVNVKAAPPPLALAGLSELTVG